MAYIDEAEANTTIATIAQSQEKTIIRGMLNRLLWEFYNKHQNEEVLTIKVFIFSKTIKVRDLRKLFVRLVGEPL